MHPILFLAAAASAPEAPPEAERNDIVVTASREPVEAQESAIPVIILRSEVSRSEALRLPMVTDYLQATPGISVAVSGPRGSQTQVRIRGAEANHTLLFVDGIRFNDPAAGNEARFEMLPIDSFDYIEAARGPG
jgi:vitamin B12 transporter